MFLIFVVFDFIDLHLLEVDPLPLLRLAVLLLILVLRPCSNAVFVDLEAGENIISKVFVTLFYTR